MTTPDERFAGAPPVRSGQRVRNFHSKGRTGCLTCKQRRVKCDERHPTCLKCEIAKKKCEGYEKLQVWVFNPDEGRDVVHPRRKPSFLHPPEDWRSLQYFFENTMPILGLYNSAAEAFWKTVIPALGQTNCAIRNQLIATAAAQELHTKPDADGAMALNSRTYTKALRLLARESKPDAQLLLISCLLSIAMESVRHDYEVAYLHLRSGLAMLREWQSNPDRKDADKVIERCIEPIFAQLEATLGLQFSHWANVIPLNQLSWTKPTIPKVFISILAAREKFQEIGVHMFMLQQNDPNYESSINPLLMEVWSLFEEWEASANALKDTVKTEREVSQCKLLDLLVRGHKSALIAHAHPHEMAWDEQVEELRAQVRLAAEINNYNQAALTKSNNFLEADFDVDPGIVPMLWQIAVGCRDPQTRRTALKLMRSHHQKCGHDDDCFIAAHAESIMLMEEEGLSTVLTCADIPESRRIRPVACDFSTPGVMRATYTRSPYVVHETVVYPVSVKQPRVQKFKMFPLSNTMRLAGYQGLIRPSAVGCRCKSFGGDVDY